MNKRCFVLARILRFFSLFVKINIFLGIFIVFDEIDFLSLRFYRFKKSISHYFFHSPQWECLLYLE